jgi:hypothetical protein
MLRSLVLMLILSSLIGLIIQLENITTSNSIMYTVSYIFGFALSILIISLLIAFIPRLIYWILKRRRPP